MASEQQGGARERAEGRAAGPDEYQERYMAGGALYYDKIRAPLAYHLLFLLPLVLSVGSAIVGHAPIFVPLVALIPLLFIWALFSVLRISVTRGEVYVQYGLFGPKIAVGDVERCEAVDYDWKKYGGWGIRYALDGSVAYNMMGDQGRAVKIVYRKGKGTKTVLVASHNPARLAAAVNEARAAAQGKVRVEATVEHEVEEAAAAETEAAAAAEKRERS